MGSKAVRVRSSALSNQRIKAEFSPQGKAVLFSVTPWDAEGSFAHCGFGSGDQSSRTPLSDLLFKNSTVLLHYVIY